jgi:nitrite reductase/ring-hydroxylating ferredoxin subunit/uncharacterized membrane protein
MELRPRDLADKVGTLKLLDRVGSPVGNTVGNLVPPGPVKDALAGTWLGHALHPVLTDLVIGSWTSAFLLDLIGERGRDGADLLIGVGVLSAVPTAVTGLSDWADTTGETKRVGVAHGLGNVAALGFYAASLVARRRGRRSTGVLLSVAGAGVVTLTAYLGGHLVYERGMGVDQTTFEPRIRKWKPAIADTDLAAGVPVARQVDGVKVMLYRTGDRIYALSNRCNHLGGPLDQGQIHDGTVVCPWHTSTFRLSDGQVLHGPATARQPTWETRVKDGQIEVRRAN